MMTTMLEIRDNIIDLYRRFENIAVPAVKFIVVLIAMMMINSSIGTDETLSSPLLAVAAALIGALVSANVTVLLLGLIIVLQLYKIAIVPAALGLVLLLLVALLYLRFVPKDTWILILTPMLCVMGIPYVIPIAAGLLFTPVSAVAAAFGLAVYKYISYISSNTGAFSSSEAADMIGQIRAIIDGIIGDDSLKVMIVAFTAAIFVVYLIRRLAIANSWLIAITAGVVVDLIVLLMGDIMDSGSISVGGVFLGSVAAFAVGVLLWFFLFNLDYSAIENVQFEDDDYYYYVKAVPKVSLSKRVKTVKKINTSRRDYETDYSEDYQEEVYEDSYGDDDFSEDSMEYADEGYTSPDLYGDTGSLDGGMLTETGSIIGPDSENGDYMNH